MGCSDHRIAHTFPSLETHVDDVLTVIDAAAPAGRPSNGAQETGFVATLRAPPPTRTGYRP